MKMIKKWVLEQKEKLFIAALAFLCAIILSLLFVLFTQEKEPNDLSAHIVSMTASSAASVAEVPEADSESIPSVMYVDIKGAVYEPGVYEMEEGDRINDLVEKAGGFTSEAEQTTVNLALRVTDQMMVYIPKEGEETPEAAHPASDSASSEGEKVNLNTATLNELTTLNGIGEKKAEKIIQYREENGSFESIEDIKKVSGIGDKTFENLKESITTSSP